jgi:hypothetical protein
MLGGGRRFSRVGLACVAALWSTGVEAEPLGWGPPPPRDPAARRTATPANAAADVRLVWIDLAGLVRGAYPEAVREVQVQLGRIGVRASVREGDVQGTSDGSELTVVVLPGPPRGGRLAHNVMGAAQRTPEGVHAIWVYASGVAGTLGLDPRTAAFWTLPERRFFGTALGRVVVHEVVHALAPQRPHSRQGLMAESMGRAQLLGRRLPIDEATARAVREAVSGRVARDGAVAAMP